MLYSFLETLESLERAKATKASDNIVRNLEAKLRRIIRELHGSDYTAALDLVNEVIGDYFGFT